MGKGAPVSGFWWLGVAVAAPLVAVAMYWVYAGLTHPMINDIVTDPERPLAFRAMPRLAPYPGEAFASRQREAYPEVVPLQLAVPPGQAQALALELIRRRGWQLVIVDEAGFVIEATARSLIFRFTDEIALQFTEAPGGSRVDMRSRSRAGRSDLGVNARRIRTFLDDLEVAARSGRISGR
jgi:uncharacterized protein (DUF1499 family)